MQPVREHTRDNALPARLPPCVVPPGLETHCQLQARTKYAGVQVSKAGVAISNTLNTRKPAKATNLSVEHMTHDLAAHILHVSLLLCVQMPAFKRRCRRAMRPMLEHARADALAPPHLLGVCPPRLHCRGEVCVEHVAGQEANKRGATVSTRIRTGLLR